MKKRWKKVLSVLMVGTVMVGSLTACGGDKEEKGTNSRPVQKTDKGQPSGKKKAIRNIHKKKGR